MKFKHIYAVCLAVFLFAAVVFVWGVSDKIKLSNSREAYHIYSSSYPVYALTSMIARDIPGLEVHMLTQPQDAGYTQYTLSDWDKALLGGCDIAVFMGGGFEAFSSDFTSDGAIVITLLGTLKLLNEDDYTVYGGESAGAIPWLYMSLDGAIDLCEALCANFSAADEDYTADYYANLNRTYDELESLRCRIPDRTGLKVAVMHPAFAYTARDINAETVLLVNRLPSEAYDESQIESYTEAVINSGAECVFIESQADVNLVNALADAGLTVYRLSLMLDMDGSYGAKGFFDSFSANMELISE